MVEYKYGVQSHELPLSEVVKGGVVTICYNVVSSTKEDGELLYTYNEGSFNTSVEVARSMMVKQMAAESKVAIVDKLTKLTVVVTRADLTTLVFDANLESRQNMADSILASEYLGVVSTTWRLADKSEVVVTLDELKQAHATSLQVYATTKSIGTN